MTTQIIDSSQLSALAIEGLEELKGQDILLMDLREVDSSVTDYFVICTGTSDRHVQSLAQSVIDHLKKSNERPISKEGIQTGEWILLDYVTVVVHIFQEETRGFYRLEKLWGDAEFKRIAS